MENSIENVKLYAESFYKQLVAVLFDLKHGQNSDSNIKLDDIQGMYSELEQKLLGLNIRTSFSFTQYNDVCENTKMIGELMFHIENVVFVLKNLQAKGNVKSNDEQIGLHNKVLTCALNTLWRVRVLEGKLDVITDCNPQIGRIRLHDIETYEQLREILSMAEELAIDLEQFEKLLEEINVKETIEFSMDGPLKQVRNYLQMFFLPSLYIREILSEKYEEIKTLRKRIEDIYIDLLNSSIV